MIRKYSRSRQIRKRLSRVNCLLRQYQRWHQGKRARRVRRRRELYHGNKRFVITTSLPWSRPGNRWLRRIHTPFLLKERFRESKSEKRGRIGRLPLPLTYAK